MTSFRSVIGRLIVVFFLEREMQIYLFGLVSFLRPFVAVVHVILYVERVAVCIPPEVETVGCLKPTGAFSPALCFCHCGFRPS